MVKHLFKLIWNKRKQNFLLITEMFVSFLVIFGLFSFLVYSYKNYKEPIGFDHKNVWVVNYGPLENLERTDSMLLFYASLRQLLHAMPQIKEATFTGNNVPFSMNSSNTGTEYNGKRVFTNVYQAEESYLTVLNIQMQQGRWFTAEDKVAKIAPVVINEKLKEQLFGTADAIGKSIGTDMDKLNVIGVVKNLKDKSAYQAVEQGMYRKMDTSGLRWSTLLLKVQPGADAAFESRLYKTLSNAIGTSIEIEHLENKLKTKNKIMLVPMIITGVVAGFLIINVALGLFGVLWYNINKRRSEIGLRRAVGATGGSISRQLVGEALVLATLSLLLGSFFAVQFPLLHVFDLPAHVYLTALFLAVGFIYLLVTLCAFYPSTQAAAIYPAVALHED